MRKLSEISGADSGLTHRLSDRNSGRTKRGFTMLELLIVVGLLCIVAAMCIPSYMSFQRNYRVRNDADGIADLMLTARMRATADFARTAVSCNPAVTPAVCTLYTLPYSGTNPCPMPALTSWTLEPQQYKLSPTDVFNLPSAAPYGVLGQSATPPAQVYSGQTAPYTLYFNSRGWPISNNSSATPPCGVVSNYALYLQDAPGALNMGIGVDATGRTQIYVLSSGTFWDIKD